jgi:hypothetical protein
MQIKGYLLIPDRMLAQTVLRESKGPKKGCFFFSPVLSTVCMDAIQIEWKSSNNRNTDRQRGFNDTVLFADDQVLVKDLLVAIYRLHIIMIEYNLKISIHKTKYYISASCCIDTSLRQTNRVY